MTHCENCQKNARNVLNLTKKNIRRQTSDTIFSERKAYEETRTKMTETMSRTSGVCQVKEQSLKLCRH